MTLDLFISDILKRKLNVVSTKRHIMQIRGKKDVPKTPYVLFSVAEN